MESEITFIYEHRRTKVEVRLDIAALGVLPIDSARGLRIYELMAIHRLADLYPFIRATLVVCEGTIFRSNKFVKEIYGSSQEELLNPGDSLSFRQWHSGFSWFDESMLSDTWLEYVYEEGEFSDWLCDQLAWVKEQQEKLVSIDHPLVQYELSEIQSHAHFWEMKIDPIGKELLPDTPIPFYDVDLKGLAVLRDLLIKDSKIQAVSVRGSGRFHLIEMLCIVKLARNASGGDLTINVLTGRESIAEGGGSEQWIRDLVFWYSEGLGRAEVFVQDGKACLGGTTPQVLVDGGRYRYLLLLGDFDIDFSSSPLIWERGLDYALGSCSFEAE